MLDETTERVGVTIDGFIMSRIVSIDYAKGFAILMLLLSHCISGEGNLKIWIFSWHMPIFFIICGMLNAMKNPDGLPFRKFSSWFRRRVVQIFVPYFVFGLLYVIFLAILSFISEGVFIFKENLISLFSLKGIASMWFLPVYFLGELLYVFVIQKNSSFLQVLFVLCIVALLSQMQYDGRILLPFPFVQIVKVLVALNFVVIGRFIWIFIKRHFHFSSNNILLWISFLFISMISIYNGFVGIGSLQLGNIYIFYAVASILSCIIILLFDDISRHIDPKNRFLNLLRFFGMNSIVVLVTNNLLIEVFRLIEYKFLENFFLNNGVLGGILMAMILVIPEYFLIYLSLGKMGFLFGKVK